MGDSSHYHLTEISNELYDAILSSHSTKSSTNNNRNLTLILAHKSLQYCKEHFLCKMLQHLSFCTDEVFYFPKLCTSVLMCPGDRTACILSSQVPMLTFYKLLNFPCTFYIHFFKTRMISDFVAGTVPFSRFSILCYAVLYPTDNLRTIECCYQLELNYYTLLYRNFSLMKLALIFCNQWKTVLFMAALKRSSDCTYF